MAEYKTVPSDLKRTHIPRLYFSRSMIVAPSETLAIPFLAVALGVGHAAKFVHRISRYLRVVSFVGGIFLIFLGVLMITNNFGVWVGFFYQFFEFLNYDALLNYL